MENPAATRVFEKFGIDYLLRRANQLLEQACGKKPASRLDEVLDALEMQAETARAASQIHDSQSEPLSELIAHIKSTHQNFTREEKMYS